MKMNERIKALRDEYGMTQEELGKKLDVKKSAIAKYESGRVENIKRSTIVKMAKIFDCDPCYILGYTDQRRKLTAAEREGELMTLFSSLNEQGQSEAISYLRYLAQKEEYKKDEAHAS